MMIFYNQISVEFTGKQLGTGAFGSFFKAKLTDHHDGTSDIVVRKYKVPKDGCRGHEVFEELKVRLHVGKHENIVNMIGINTLNIAKGKIGLYTVLYDM